MVDSSIERPREEASVFATLPFTSERDSPYPLRRRSLHIHEHSCQRYRCRARTLGTVEGVRYTYTGVLLVSGLLSFLFFFSCITVLLPRVTRSFGAAFTPFYRLFGPFRSPTAPSIIKTELWDTITRRGLLGNLLMGVIPMAFYLFISTMAFCAEVLWNVVRGCQ